jgi:translation initiation factor IF-2
MTHPHKEARRPVARTGKTAQAASTEEARPKLEIVLKCDSKGSLEAAATAVSGIVIPGMDISIIRKGLGAVTASDVFLAETAGRMIVGFQVDVLPGVEKILRLHNVEIRLYSVIYTLTDDLKLLAESILPHIPGEQIIGSAKVIALFKSTRKGIIAGCEVVEGRLAVGQRFRVISAMGPVYSGTIESLHIGEHAAQTASPGQQAGIRIRNFSGVKAGDIVESYRPQKRPEAWRPAGAIIRK